MPKVFIDEDGYLLSHLKPNGKIPVSVSEKKYDELMMCKMYHNWKLLDNGLWVQEEIDGDKYYRLLRQDECFDIIDNRSQLWWNNLTEDQKSELSKWYNDWLNVTETKVIPDKPEWLH